jgi:hypothetical protein
MSSSYYDVSEYLTGSFLSEFLRLGDTFHLIVFSDNPKLDAARRVSDIGDVETIIGRILLHYPVENGSNLGAALNFTEQYIKSLPLRPKKIIVVSISSSDTEPLISAARQRLNSGNITLDFLQINPGQPLANIPNSQRGGTTSSQNSAQYGAGSISGASASSGTTSASGAVTASTGTTSVSETASSSDAASNSNSTYTSGSVSSSETVSASETYTPSQQRSEETVSDQEERLDEEIIAIKTEPSFPSTTGSSDNESRLNVQETAPNDSQGSRGKIPVIPIIIIFLLLLFSIIIFFILRNRNSGANRITRKNSSKNDDDDDLPSFADHSKELAQYAAVLPKQRTTPYTNRPLRNESNKMPVIHPTGPLLLNLYVEDQSTAIGKRNIHSLKSGYSLSVGGGKSDFFIFLVSMPPNIGEIRRNGSQCTFVPKKPKYFPDLGASELRDCINKPIRIVSDKKYEMQIRFEMYEDPLDALNRILMSIKVPG